MSLEYMKISPGDISSMGVCAAPDRLSGSAQENKGVFDRLIRDCVADKFNALIEALEDGGGGGGLPYVLPVAGPDNLGGVKIGDGLAVTEDGVLSLDIPNGDGVSY